MVYQSGRVDGNTSWPMLGIQFGRKTCVVGNTVVQMGILYSVTYYLGKNHVRSARL